MATVEFDSVGVDTVWMDVPQGLYADDAGVKLSVERVSGSYAALCQLALFQVAPITRDIGAQALAAKLPEKVQLLPCAPNPLDLATRVRFTVPVPCRANAAVYDASGRLARTLLDGQVVEPGLHTMTWHGEDNGGRSLPAGIYFVRLAADGVEQRTKVVLSR